MSYRTAEAGRRRSLVRGARALVLVGLALLVVGIALQRPAGPVGHAQFLAGRGSLPGDAPASMNATVNLTDRPSFDPNNLSVPAGTVLHLFLKDTGSLNHSFTLANRSGAVLVRSWTPAQLDQYFHLNGTQANVTLRPGASAEVNLTFAASGAGDSFEFASIVPYQFQAGMWGSLNVTGPPTGPGAVLSVATSGTALAFLPAVLSVNPSAYPATIDIGVSNIGSNAHTFWLARQPNLTLNSGNFSTYFVQHPPLASVNVPSQPGVIAWANFSVASAGVYEFICTIPGHFAGGMLGYLYVGVAPPAVAQPPSTAIVSEWVLWGGAGILGLGSLLAGVALLVGRIPRAPPSHGH